MPVDGHSGGEGGGGGQVQGTNLQAEKTSGFAAFHVEVQEQTLAIM